MHRLKTAIHSPSFQRIHSSILNGTRRSIATPRRHWLSSTTNDTSSSNTPPPPNITPPTSLNAEMALGIQSATLLYIRHGLGHRRLVEIRNIDTTTTDEPTNSSSSSSSLVTRWQKMMEAFLGTQVHVLAGLGYSPDEKGIGLYNQHLAQFMNGAEADPKEQEQIRIQSRDLWREVMSTAFDVDIQEKELSVVDARNVMHKVSMRMQEPRILEMVARRTAKIGDAPSKAAEIGQKHTAVQEILVNEVYLGGTPTLVSECGFDDGEKGYVQFQCALAEHQSDPLISQYVATAMMKILQVAGLDGTLRQG